MEKHRPHICRLTRDKSEWNSHYILRCSESTIHTGLKSQAFNRKDGNSTKILYGNPKQPFTKEFMSHTAD